MTPGEAQGAAGSGEGELSMRLAQLAKPSIRSAPPRKQAKALGLSSSGPGSLLRWGNRVLVEVHFDHGAAAEVDDLRAAGMQIIHVSRRYQTVTVAAKPAELHRLNHVGLVRSATEVLTPILHGAPGEGPVGAAISPPCFGADTSEGDKQLRADKARAEFAIDGNGVKVGVLSDSFDRDPTAPTSAADDVASGDLPGPGNPCGHVTPVEVLKDLKEEGTDEGRAMAQIAHDLAPGAALAFATAFEGETGFAANIRALAKEGAKTIVDDVSYFEEPFFQEGPVGVAVSEVTEKDDVAYFSAAGNDNLIDGEGHNIGSWEAPEFRESPTCPPGVVALSELFEEEFEFGLNPEHCMDFDPRVGPTETDNTFGITVEPEETLVLDLQWAEPWFGVKTDLDAFLLDSEGDVLTGSVEDNVFESQRPLEIISWENEDAAPAEVQLVINRFGGLPPTTMPRLKFILLQNGGGVSEIEYPESSEGDIVGPTIFGHNGGTNAMSIGAIRFNTTTKPEFFSSQGPVTHYFGPVKALPVAAEELKPPEILAKPDVVATDGGANTFFGSCVGNVWRFFGTSAAAPHAAAVAALERDSEPEAKALQVENAQREAALPVGSFPPTAVGAGLLDAVGALEKLGVIPPFPGEEPAAPPAQGPCLAPQKPITPVPTPVPTPPITPPLEPPPALDTTAPETFFRRHPSHAIRTAARRVRVVFHFGSDEGNVTFLCRVDRRPEHYCAERRVRIFRVGRHVMRVRAQDAAGNVDPTPAVFRFRVMRRR